MTRLHLLCLAPLCLAACAVGDSRVAHRARMQLLGLREVDLQSCLGSPDQHSTFGNVDVLTYYATSTSSTSLAVPLVGGIGLSYGGYCHATFQVTNGRVTQILYSGEKNALFAPDSYCAPILATCLAHLEQVPADRAGAAAMPAAAGGSDGGTVPAHPAGPASAMPAQSTPPGAGVPAAAP
jgi:hypothetical protein